MTPTLLDQLAEALRDLERYSDGIVCYASTMGEHEPNRIVHAARAALTLYDESRRAQGGVDEAPTVAQIAGMLPDTHCVVPRKHTNAIMYAFLGANIGGTFGQCYDAMLAAGAVRGEGK